MAKSRDSYGQALVALRASLRDGGAPPGLPLVVVDLAKALKISPTPVREALSRLTGEGLIEETRGRGFTVRRLEASDVEALYQIHALYIAAPLEMTAERPPASSAPRPTPTTSQSAPSEMVRHRSSTEELWARIIRMSNNPSLERALSILADQLSLARLVDQEVLSDAAEELQTLADLEAAGDILGLRHGAMRYHQRRKAVAAQLATAIRERFPYRLKIFRI